MSNKAHIKWFPVNYGILLISQEAIWDAEDQTWVGCMQDKFHTCYAMAWAPFCGLFK